MATSDYIVGRKSYTRPQAVLWSENPGTLVDGLYIPTGQEVGAASNLPTTAQPANQFLILSDHNRSSIDFKPTRIELRQRMVNGNMRSYHIADKLNISFSWTNLPSRAYPNVAKFDAVGKPNQSLEYTVDGGAGGVELLDWYERHQGPFWMFLAYDKYNNFGKDDNAFLHLTGYNEIVQVYFSNFNYTVQKRGRTNHDLWDISVELEEA